MRADAELETASAHTTPQKDLRTHVLRPEILLRKGGVLRADAVLE